MSWWLAALVLVLVALAVSLALAAWLWVRTRALLTEVARLGERVDELGRLADGLRLPDGRDG